MQSFDREGQHAADAGALQPLASSGRGLRDLKSATKYIRLGFVRKVYGLLTAQLAVTVVVGGYVYAGGRDRSWLRSHEWLLWLSIVMTLSTVCAMACCEHMCRTYPTNYIFLFAFTFFEAIMIGFVSAVFTWQSVLLAAAATVLVFLGFTLYAFYTEVDFTGLGPYLFAALLVMGVFGLFLAVMPALGLNADAGIVAYDVLGVLIFSFYIVFDTQLMLGAYGGHRLSLTVDDYVFASLNLYMDLVNLFAHILTLLGDRAD